MSKKAADIVARNLAGLTPGLGVPSTGPATPGRKSNAAYAAEAKRRLHEAAIIAATYLRDIAGNYEKKPSALRVDVCKYIIDQVIGKPRQSTEIKRTADDFNYGDLLASAVKVLKTDGDAEPVAVPEIKGTPQPIETGEFREMDDAADSSEPELPF
jgi:hypothetical protein